MGEKQLELVLPRECGADPNEVMEELCECVDRFNDHWPQYIKQAVAYKIPFYENGKVPDVVEVDRIDGGDAVELCKAAFRAFSRQPGVQHPGNVYRLPGYIELDRLLLDEIDEINGLKAKLQNTIKELHPKPTSRNQYCRRVFPGRVMLQAYRRIHTARSVAHALKFSWSPGTYGATSLKKPEVIEMLTSRLESGIDEGSQKKSLEFAIAKVRAMGKKTKIIRSRPRAPHPVASFVLERGRSPKGIKKMFPVSLPVFVGPGVDGERVSIGELYSHDKSDRRIPRSDRVKSTPLFNPLCLRYL